MTDPVTRHGIAKRTDIVFKKTLHYSAAYSIKNVRAQIKTGS